MSDDPTLPPILDYASPGTRRPRPRSLVTVLVVIGLLMLAMAILLPSRNGGRPDRVRCAANLRSIGQGLMMYANDHGGQYPDSLAALITDEDMNPGILLCPSCNGTQATGSTTQALLADFAKPGRCDYIYLGKGLRNPFPPNLVLAFEPITDHTGKGANVLFGDGHAEWLDQPAMITLLTDLAAGRNPPPSLGGSP